MKVFTLDCFKMSKSWIKSCFKIQICRWISFVPMGTITMFTEGCVFIMPQSLAELLLTVATGKQSCGGFCFHMPDDGVPDDDCNGTWTELRGRQPRAPVMLRVSGGGSLVG